MLKQWIARLSCIIGTSLSAESPLPFDVGGDFRLVDHKGAVRTQADPDGQPQLLFFGYANCPGICTAAMPMMADITDDISDRGVKLRPVMITIDPARDTVDNMGEPLAQIHDDFVGLTGSDGALSQAYDAFSVEHELAYEDPEYGPVYAHGSLIYLLNGAGDVLTIIPPVLDAQSASNIVWTYVKPST
ncbi:MAG: SCO family protein [Sulfitobacter sp.]